MKIHLMDVRRCPSFSRLAVCYVFLQIIFHLTFPIQATVNEEITNTNECKCNYNVQYALINPFSIFSIIIHEFSFVFISFLNLSYAFCKGSLSDQGCAHLQSQECAEMPPRKFMFLDTVCYLAFLFLLQLTLNNTYFLFVGQSHG